MKTLFLSLALLAGSVGTALADGIFGGCDSDHDGSWDCSDGDGGSGGTCDARDTTARHSVSVGASLALLGFVVHRVTRRRRK